VAINDKNMHQLFFQISQPIQTSKQNHNSHKALYVNLTARKQQGRAFNLFHMATFQNCEIFFHSTPFQFLPAPQKLGDAELIE
jgi:hypothetical protein